MVAEQAVFPGFEDLADDEELNSPEGAYLRWAAAREAFEGLLESEPGCKALVEPYLDLLSQGWTWRKALYIAWAKLPVRGRWPRTMEELAGVMGLRSSRAIRGWRQKNPGIDYIVNLGRAQAVTERTMAVLNKAHEVAIGEGYKGHNDRKLLLGIDGVYQPSQDITLHQSAVNADDMAAAAQEAEEELDEWEAGRFGEEEEGLSPDLTGSEQTCQVEEEETAEAATTNGEAVQVEDEDDVLA